MSRDDEPSPPSSPVTLPELGVIDEGSDTEDGPEQQKVGGGKSRLTLTEKADLAKIEELLQDNRLESSYRRYLCALYDSVNLTGGLEVCYRLPRGVMRARRKGPYVGCRLYADGGLQNAPVSLRRLVLGAGHLELDIRNSVPFFLYWLASSLEAAPAGELVYLKRFVTDREQVIADVKDSLGVNDNELVKSYMLKLVHGGRWLKLPNGTEVEADTYPVTANFRASVKRAVAGLAKYFPKLWQWCEASNLSSTPDGQTLLFHARGRFVHFLTTRFENEVMMRVIDFFGKENVSTLVHDAVFVRTTAVDVEALNGYIAAAGPLSGVETPRPDSKTIEIDGVRRSVPVLLPPVVAWRVTTVECAASDKQSLYRPEVAPHDLVGCANVRRYATEADMYQPKPGLYVIHPVSFDVHRAQVVNAVTGIGKTVAGFGAVADTLKQKRKSRIVWVVGRISQAQDSDRRLEEYLREQGVQTHVCMYENASRDDIRDARVVMIQHESLWKLFKPEEQDRGRNELLCADLVVLDEVLLIFNQSICTETNGNRLRDNDNVLRALCEDAPRLLVLDKDVHRSSHLYDFLLCDGGGVCRQEGKLTVKEAQQQIEFHLYSYVPPHLRRSLMVVASHRDWFDAIVSAIRDGKKFIVSCHTQREAAALYDRLHKSFPDLCPRRPCSAGTALSVRTTVSTDWRQRTQGETEIVAREDLARATWADGASIRLLDGQTSKSTAKQLMTMINEFFALPGARGLIHTSRLCVAVDIQSTVDLVLLHCARKGKVSKLGPPARILCQMLMRARRVSDPCIRAYFGEGGLQAPRAFAASKTTLPWQHCEIFQQYERDYTGKETRMKALYRATGIQSPWAVIERGYKWIRVCDPSSGESKRIEVPSSLKLRLLASLTEQRQSRGAAIWDWLVQQDFQVALPPRLSTEQREAKKQAAEEAKEQEEAEKEEQEGMPPEPTREEMVIREGVDWLVLTPEDVDQRLKFLWKKQRHSDDEKHEMKILGVLSLYPGALGDCKKMREELAKKCQASTDSVAANWLVHEWAQQVKLFLQRCKKAGERLDNFALGQGQEGRAWQLDDDGRQIPVNAKSSLAMYQSLNGLAQVLGAESLAELLKDASKTYPLSLLRDKKDTLAALAQKVKDASAGISKQGIKSSKKGSKCKALANFVLGQAGLVVEETGQKERKQVAGKRTSTATFRIAKLANVHEVCKWHHETWSKDAQRLLMESAKKRKGTEGSSASNKKRKTTH